MARRDVVPWRRQAQIPQHLQRGEQDGEWRPTRRDLPEMALVELVRGLLDEARDELVVVLRGGTAVLLADAQERRRVSSEPLLVPTRGERVEELVEEARSPETVAQALLVLRTHEEHLLHEQL